jgi:hypothetical protein
MLTDAGTVFTGAWLTAVTVIVNVWAALVFELGGGAPSPLSTAVTLTSAVPEVPFVAV